MVWGIGRLRNPCRLHLGLVLPRRLCPELMVGANAAPRQLPLYVFQMLDCTDLREELDCALGIFPMYLQSQCLGMPTLVLRGILKLTKMPDTVSRRQLGQQPRVEQWVTQWLGLFWALGAVLAAASSPASPALCPMAVPCTERGGRAKGNGLPLPARPSRNAGGRATSPSVGSAEPGRGVPTPRVKCSGC